MAKTKQAEVYFYDIEVAPNLFMVTLKKKGGKDEPNKIGEGPEDGNIWTWIINEQYNDLQKIAAFFFDMNKYFVGYNSVDFDNQLINYIIKNYGGLSVLSTEDVCRTLQDRANKAVGKDREYKYLNYFNSIDLMRIIQIGLQRKALKLVAVNLKWKKIQDLPYKPNEYVPEDQLDTIQAYNINDVLITEQLYYNLQKAINLRARISHRYKVNVMSESNSGIGGKLFEKMYSEVTGLRYSQFVYLRSEKTQVSFANIISKKVGFKTKSLQGFLSNLKKTTISVRAKPEYHVLVGNTTYKIAKGGIHSEHTPVIYEENDEYTLIDADVGSYYPKIVVNEGICPDHLSHAFVKLMEKIMIERLEAKKTDPIKAAALKIAINGAFGKFGFEHSWLYDPDALLGVTINGQLFLLMLIEALEMRGIRVVYANTDGITVRIKRDREEEFFKICRAWEKYLDFNLEYTRFKKFIIEDVNSYLVEKLEESDDGITWIKKKGMKRKGRMNKNLHEEDLMKSFKFPIVAQAVEEYLINGVPLEETIKGAKDPLDFCMAEKIGDAFKGVYFDYLDLENRQVVTEELQRINRYLIGTKGGTIYKVKKKDGAQHALSHTGGEQVILVNDYEEMMKKYPEGPPINYTFYLKQARKVVFKFENVQHGLFD